MEVCDIKEVEAPMIKCLMSNYHGQDLNAILEVVEHTLHPEWRDRASVAKALQLQLFQKS